MRTHKDRPCHADAGDNESPTDARFYELLKLDAHATQQHIEFAYRTLARLHYAQDKPGAAAQMEFDAVARAYSVLSNIEARAVYDDFERRRRAASRHNTKAGATHDSTDDNAWDLNVAFSGSAFGHNLNERRSDFFESLWRGLESASGTYQPASIYRPDTTLQAEPVDHARHAKVCISHQDACRGGRCVVCLRVPQVDAQGGVTLLEYELAVTIPKGAHSGERLCIPAAPHRATRPVERAKERALRPTAARADASACNWYLQLEVQ
jgi:curved DNA-binding protein